MVPRTALKGANVTQNTKSGQSDGTRTDSSHPIGAPHHPPKYARWPYRGPMLMVTNPTQSRLVVSARDGMGRELVTATIKPNGKR